MVHWDLRRLPWMENDILDCIIPSIESNGLYKVVNQELPCLVETQCDISRGIGYELVFLSKLDETLDI